LFLYIAPSPVLGDVAAGFLFLFSSRRNGDSVSPAACRRGNYYFIRGLVCFYIVSTGTWVTLYTGDMGNTFQGL